MCWTRRKTVAASSTFVSKALLLASKSIRYAAAPQNSIRVLFFTLGMFVVSRPLGAGVQFSDQQINTQQQSTLQTAPLFSSEWSASQQAVSQAMDSSQPDKRPAASQVG